ncbi:MAG: lycopene cyclase family protein [Vulcanimicrobiaceae bacterium]
MSLACALVERGFAGEIALVDRRADPDVRRTWCWWDVPDVAFRRLATHRWNAWRIVDGSRHVVRRSVRHGYVCIRGADFYDAVRLRLARTRVREIRDESVARIVEHPGGVVLACASGRTFEADVAVDARGTRGPTRDGTLVQRFVGRFVRVADPVFAPDVATLMDFGPSPDDVARFTYVLPFAPDRALVEDTRFTTRGADDANQRSAIDAYVREALATTIVDDDGDEVGALPLVALAPPKPTRRIGFAGIAGGAIRPSSGYAFVRTQRHVAAIAEAICNDAPFPTIATGRYRLLDAALLAMLRRRIVAAPAFFTRLFANAPPDAIARFLSDASTLTDDARLLGGLLRPTSA